MLNEIKLRLAYWRVVHQTAWALRRLPDRTLRDLGIERGHISCLAREASRTAILD